MFDTARLKAQKGYGQVSTANSNRDGTGTTVLIFTGQNSFGSVINYITVKAESTTTPGMVRIFVKDAALWYLLQEFPIPASDPTGVLESYETMVYFPGNGLWVPQDVEIHATTENAEVFNVIANGFTWDYCACP